MQFDDPIDSEVESFVHLDQDEEKRQELEAESQIKPIMSQILQKQPTSLSLGMKNSILSTMSHLRQRKRTQKALKKKNAFVESLSSKPN